MPCPVLPCPALPNGDKAAQMSARPLDTWRRKTHVTPGQPLKKLLRGVTKTTTAAGSAIGLFTNDTQESGARDTIAAV